MNLTLRDTILDTLYGLIDSDRHDGVTLYCEGSKKYEDEIADIVDSIECLAIAMEDEVVRREEYIVSGDAGLDEGDRKCHEMRENGR